MNAQNCLVFEGFLGGNSEISHTDSGQAYLKLWIVRRDKWKDKNDNERESRAELNATLWGKQAESFTGEKGDRVIFRGELRTNEYKGKKYTEGKVDRIDVVWRKNAPKVSATAQPAATDDDPGEDLPF